MNDIFVNFEMIECLKCSNHIVNNLQFKEQFSNLKYKASIISFCRHIFINKFEHLLRINGL
jgi:hypothetical protein